MEQKKQEEIVLPPPVEEPIVATTIEKQRSNKNRNVAKQDTEPILSNRYGPHYIKTSFLIDRSNVTNQPSNEELNLFKVYQELAQHYSSMNWQVNEDALAACSMTVAEKKLASSRKVTAAEPVGITCCPPVKPMQSREIGVEIEHMQIRRRKKVLVPVSGGLTSLATLWWCLLQDFDVYLCYAFDSLSRQPNSVENPFEIQCLLRLLQYARRKDGTLLFECAEKGGGVYELTRAEIQQRIRVVQVPLSSYYMQNIDAVPQIMATENSLKAHPQSYLLFYRQMIIVAQSLSCSAIVVGLCGHGKTLLEAANPAWTAVHRHELIFPFNSRKEVLNAFQDAVEQSWNVWKSYLQSDENSKTAGMWQTAGPSLMPNTAHYVTTCQTRPRTSLEDQMLQAQEAALARIQQLIEVENQKEQDAIDDATARGEKMRKKRAVDPFQHPEYLTLFLRELENICTDIVEEKAFNFCNQKACNDCCVWQSVTKEWHSKTDVVRSKWQNLASEYCARLRKHFEQKKTNANSIIVAKNLPKKRELTLADVVGKPTKKPRLSVDEDEDIDDKVEEEDDEDIEEADFEDEDEEEVGDEEEEEGAVILAEDEEVQEEEEEEEEAVEEEKEKDEDDEELDDELDEDEEEEDDDEEDDDDDDDGGGGDEDY